MSLQVAVAARTLFHSTEDATAALETFDQEAPLNLLSTTMLRAEGPERGHALGFMGLAPATAGFQPFLGTGDRKELVPLLRWWAEEPIMSMMRDPFQTITRRQLVLAAANVSGERHVMQDGDFAHLESGLKIEIKGRFQRGPLRSVKLLNAHLTALRQIGFEILSSPQIRALAGLDDPAPKAETPPPMIDVEKEMARCVRNSGGKVVTDIVGPSPPFRNADYIFPGDNIVAELKCLIEDKSEDRHLQENLEKLFDSYIDTGRIPDPGPGRYVVDSKVLPLALQKAIYTLFARPIKRRIDKANKQIRQTKKHLNMPNALGLVFLVNDGNFRLDPAQWFHAVDVALGQDFSSINGLVLFTSNMLATSPKLNRHALVWIPVSRRNHAPIPQEFLKRFWEGWSSHISSVTGKEMPAILMASEDLDTVRFDRVISRSRR